MKRTGARHQAGAVKSKMPWRLLLQSFFYIAMLAAPLSASEASPNREDESAVAAITAKVDGYIQSIDLADTKLAATIWATTPSVSFIHPRGHERGWEAIAANFYGKTMDEPFSKRTLRRVGDLSIQVYDHAAVVEFDWDFVAIRKDNGQPLHTTGRESQTYIRLPKQGWRLVQVHYSGPAVTGAGNGF